MTQYARTTSDDPRSKIHLDPEPTFWETHRTAIVVGVPLGLVTGWVVDIFVRGF